MAVTLKTPLVIVTNEDLVRASRDNPGYRFEREDDGKVVVSPTHTKGGAKSLEAGVQLYKYAKQVGGKAFDSNTGFAIGPGLRVYSPDAAWVSRQRIDAVPKEQLEGFWAISPDVVIEVRSDTDSFAETIAKVERFVERGAGYAIALDPITRTIEERGSKPVDLELDFDAILDA